MEVKVYLPLAVIAFLAATTGADMVARTSIAGEPFLIALRQHFVEAGTQVGFTLLLLAPFVVVALVCARVETQARSRSAAVTFGIATLTLLYFYFQGYQGAQQALLEGRWTAAALSVGLLPFIGVPVILATIGLGAIAVKFDRRVSD